MQNCRFIRLMLHDFLFNSCWTHLHTNEGKKRRSSPKNCVSRLCNRRQMRHQSIISEPSHDHFAESLMVFLFSKSFPNRQVGNKACCTTTYNEAVYYVCTDTNTRSIYFCHYLVSFCFICGACMHYTSICKHVLMCACYKQAPYGLIW